MKQSIIYTTLLANAKVLKTILKYAIMLIAAVMLVCMVILGVLVSRMKITQALKLGED